MRRIFVIMTVLAIALFAAPGNPASAQGGTTLNFLPPVKYADLVLTSYAETNVDTNLALGQIAANQRRAQGLKVPVTRAIGRVSLWLKTSGTPTDNLTVEIQTNSGGLPSNTMVTNGQSAIVQGSDYVETGGNVDTDLAVGQSAANERRSQGFKVLTDRSVSEVRLWLKKSGAPTDNLTVEIQTDSGGLPSGTVVTNGLSSAVAGSSVGSSYGWVILNFSVPPQLTAGTQYHLVLRRSGSADAANYYLWGADQSSPAYSNGAGSVYPLALSSYAETNVDTDLAVGQNATNERRAQGFNVLTDRSVGEVRLWLKKSGAPTDNLTLQIQTDSGGLPSGVVTNGTSNAVAGTSIGSSYGSIAFDFATPPDLMAGLQYHLVLKRSGSADAANYYLWGADQSSPAYSDGAGGVYPLVLSSYAETNVDTDLAVGQATANQRRAQGLKVLTDRSVSQVRLWLKKSGAPSDNLTVEIQTNSGGLPSGTVVTNGTSNAVAGTSIGSSYGWITFDFTGLVQLTAGTQYHLVLKRSDTWSGTNYYVWGADQSSPGYTDGAGSVWGGSSWLATSPATDHAFGVYNLSWQATSPATDHAFGVYNWSWQATSPSTDHAFRVIPASVSYGWVAFDFTAGSTLPQLTAGTQYHLVLKRAGPVDPTNYYVWGADQSSPQYADGAGSVWGGSSWLATSPATDHAFRVAAAFTVDVYVKDVLDTTDPCAPFSQTEACGLGGYQFKVLFDPTAMKYVSVQNGAFLTSTGRLIASCYNPSGHDPSNGALTYNCTTNGNPPGGATPFGPEGSGVLSTITFIPLAAGTTPLQFQNTYLPEVAAAVIPHTTEDGSVTLADFVGVPSTDSDGDGCTDLEELGDNPALGGDRNPSFAYDFYDVPVPANRDPAPNGPRDKAITMSDVLAVLSYVGARAGYPPNPNGLDYDSDKGVDTNGDTIAEIPPDGVPDGRDYDRSPSWPFSGAPMGAVTMGQVLAALAQVGHNCAAPP